MAKKPIKVRTRAQAKPVAQRKVARKIPRSLMEASKAVETMRTTATMRQTLKRAYDDEIAALQTALASKKDEKKRALAPLDAKIAGIADSVLDYVEAKRDELTRRGEVKNVQFLLDDIGRWTTATYVDYDEDEKQKLIDEILKEELYHLLKIEPEKNAIATYLKGGNTLTHAQMSTRNRFRYELTGVVDRIVTELSSDGREWFFDTPKEKSEPAAQEE